MTTPPSPPQAKRAGESAAEPSVYWAAGTRVLRDRLAARGGTVVELDMGVLAPPAVGDELAGSGATAVLVLAGHQGAGNGCLLPRRSGLSGVPCLLKMSDDG